MWYVERTAAIMTEEEFEKAVEDLANDYANDADFYYDWKQSTHSNNTDDFFDFCRMLAREDMEQSFRPVED